MRAETLKTAERYGITKQDIEGFATDYGWQPVEWVHVKRNKEFRVMTHDYLTVTDGELETTVEIVKTYCPICGENAVFYGWSEGGAHISSCKCGAVDAEELYD